MSRRNRKPRRNATKTPPPAWKVAGFRSSLEHAGAINMDERGIKYTFEPCVIQYQVNETKKYTPDFKLQGYPFYLEFKGWFTLEDRKKAIRVRESNPDKEVRFVFQNSNNKIRRGSKTSYADWCDTNGFMWADMYVPQHWLNNDDEKEDT